MMSTGEGNGKPLQWFENTMNKMKRQKGMTLKDELPRSVGILYDTGEEWRVLAKRGPLEKGMANHFSILALKTP